MKRIITALLIACVAGTCFADTIKITIDPNSNIELIVNQEMDRRFQEQPYRPHIETLEEENEREARICLEAFVTAGIVLGLIFYTSQDHHSSCEY